jgi:outer membrane protein assembly factor BamE (lipoprotein component of BamABCDE complex)
MKKAFAPALVCAAASLLLSACSSAPKCAASGKQVVAKSCTPSCVLEKQSPVRVGMTKAEVLSIWGKPSTRTVNSKGEYWTWQGTSWKRCFPIIGDHFNTETYSVDFSPSGKVTEYKIHHLIGHPFQEEAASGTILPSSGSR